MNYGEWHRDGDLGQGAPLMPGAEDLDAPGDEHLFLDETKYGRNTYRYNEKKVDIFSICTRPVQILCGLLLIVSLATLLVTLVVGRSVTPPLEPTYPASSSAQHSRAAVVTDDVTCSQIGTEILHQRGSAVDAAIAASLCMGVVHFHTSGIGGGFVMTIYDSPVDGSAKKVDVLNAFSKPPLSVQMNAESTNESFVRGGASVAIPGSIRGFWQAHQRYGRLPWQKLFQASILLAERGFVVSSGLAGAVERLLQNGTAPEGVREIITKEDGSYIKQGDTLKLPKLAESLRTISSEGHLIFYDGYLAADILADIQDEGSSMTLDDLVSYKTEWETPLRTALATGAWALYTPPPPSLGLVYAYVLSIVDGYKLDENSVSDLANSVDTYHVLSEAFGFGAAAASLLRHDASNVTQIMKNLTSSDYVNHIRSLIKLNSTYQHEYKQDMFTGEQTRGGSSLSILSPDGGAVSIAMTLNSEFGAGFIGNRSGILFNNALDELNGRKLLTSLCPSFLFDATNRLRLIVGSSGGSRIPMASAFVTMQHIWLGYSLTDSISKFRINHEIDGNSVVYETGFLQSILNGLREKGQLIFQSNDQGSVNAIRSDCGATCTETTPCINCLQAVCDRRKGGEPDGL